MTSSLRILIGIATFLLCQIGSTVIAQDERSAPISCPLPVADKTIDILSYKVCLATNKFMNNEDLYFRVTQVMLNAGTSKRCRIARWSLAQYMQGTVAAPGSAVWEIWEPPSDYTNKAKSCAVMTEIPESPLHTSEGLDEELILKDLMTLTSKLSQDFLADTEGSEPLKIEFLFDVYDGVEGTVPISNLIIQFMQNSSEPEKMELINHFSFLADDYIANGHKNGYKWYEIRRPYNAVGRSRRVASLFVSEVFGYELPSRKVQYCRNDNFNTQTWNAKRHWFSRHHRTNGRINICRCTDIDNRKCNGH